MKTLIFTFLKEWRDAFLAYWLFLHLYDKNKKPYTAVTCGSPSKLFFIKAYMWNVTGTSTRYFPVGFAQFLKGDPDITKPLCNVCFVGKKKFLLGERACSADCAVFGMLAQIHWHSPDSESVKIYKSQYLCPKHVQLQSFVHLNFPLTKTQRVLNTIFEKTFNTFSA